MASPVFVVTDVGLANTFPDPNFPNRIVIHITDFEIGSAFGQTPTRFDTGLYGNRVYGPQTPTTYATIPGGGVDIVLTIPPDAGPFEYGEVAIYNDGPNGRTLFAHAIFDSPQTKYSSLETNVGSSEVFHALIRLEQSTAIFQIDSLIDPTINTVELWSDVVAPSLGTDPSTPLTRVLEADPIGDASLLINANPGHWTVGTTYDFLRDSTIANATTTSVDIAGAGFDPDFPSAINRRYVVEFLSTGLFRSASNAALVGANYRLTLNPAPLPDIPTVGSAVRVYEAAALKQVPLATATTPGRLRPGLGARIATPGVFDVYGLLHGSPNGPNVAGAGFQLTTGDNLNTDPSNAAALPSGVYAVNQGFMPIGMVPNVNWPGHIVIQNYGTYQAGARVANQIYYPAAFGQTGDAQGVGGLPPYWRSWNYFAGIWTNWFPFKVFNKVDINNPGGTGVLEGPFASGTTDVSGTFTADGETIYGRNSGSDPAIQGYINGNMVVTGDSDGGSEGITIVGYAGATWRITAARAITWARMRYTN